MHRLGSREPDACEFEGGNVRAQQLRELELSFVLGADLLHVARRPSGAANRPRAHARG